MKKNLISITSLVLISVFALSACGGMSDIASIVSNQLESAQAASEALTQAVPPALDADTSAGIVQTQSVDTSP